MVRDDRNGRGMTNPPPSRRPRYLRRALLRQEPFAGQPLVRVLGRCRGAMGIAGAAARRNLGRRRAFWLDGGLGSSNRPFPRRRPRADVSERGGPGLPSPQNWATPGEPARPNRRGVRSLPWLNTGDTESRASLLPR